MALTILIAMCCPLGKLKLKSRMVNSYVTKSSLVYQTLWQQGAYRLENPAISALRPKGLVHETIPSLSPCSAIIANKTGRIYSSSQLFNAECKISNLRRNPTLSAASTRFCVTVHRVILTKGKFDEFTISSIDELNVDACLDSSKNILVQ